jgi:PAS domain S-box-containing protein
MAGGLAWWVHGRNSKAIAAAGQLTNLSGQLSAEQLKADTIMASIGEGVMVIDAARKIQLFNNAAQQLTGWDADSAASIDCDAVLQLRTPDDQPVNELNDPFAEAWKKGTTVVRDNLTTTSRAGSKKQVHLSVSPIFNSLHQPSGAIALMRDISREKSVEREKNEFISTASHEMRTPVAAIEGYISLAMNPNVATIDDRAKKYLEKSHETIQHLGQLFKDLLSVTKAEEGVVGGKIEAINLGQLLQASVDDMQFAAGKKKLTLVFQIGGATGKTISPLYYIASNAERLREVVENLIDNAIKFTTEGGIKVTLEGNEKEVIVGVADTGMGIPPEDIPHLFQKFYRVDSDASHTIGGTGLGLYLCRRVIEAFNGRIWVDSKPGQGSNFHFSLPRLSDDEVERLQSTTTVQPSVEDSQPAASATPISQTPVLQEPVELPVPTEETPPAGSTDSSIEAIPGAPEPESLAVKPDFAPPVGLRLTDITNRRRIR